MPDAILGLSAFYHDSAAAILVDGQIVAAAQEERFTRKKHDPDFPAQALAYFMAEAGLKLSDLDTWPSTTSRTQVRAPAGDLPRLCAPAAEELPLAMPVWIKEKLMSALLRRRTGQGWARGAAAAVPGAPPVPCGQRLLPSPFEEAAILTLDGVGEWATSTIGIGKGKEISILRSCNSRTRSACSTRLSPITAASRSTAANTSSWAWPPTAIPRPR